MAYRIRMQTMVGDLEFERGTEAQACALANKLQCSCRVPITVIESDTGRIVAPTLESEPIPRKGAGLAQ